MRAGYHEREEILPDGNVKLEFKRPWSDGTTSIELSPLALIARLAALVAPAGGLSFCERC